MTVRQILGVTTLCLPLALPAAAAGQAPAAMGVTKNVADMTFAPVPGLPTCGTAAVQTGDPSKGNTIILAKMTAGCIVPWHWHSPNEHLMLAGGVARLEMKDGAPFTLRAGGFALMPSKHVHQFTCQQACLLYIYSDAPFDTHYVDAKGTEITPTAALAAVKEKTVEPK